MISVTNRVIDYFTTIGVGDKLLKNNQFEEEGKLFKKKKNLKQNQKKLIIKSIYPQIYIFFKKKIFNFIYIYQNLIDLPLTGLEIIFQYISEVKETQYEKYLDLEGTKTVWLKCYYDKQNPAITEINFLYFKTQNNYLVKMHIQQQFFIQKKIQLQKIKQKYNYIPVAIKKNLEEEVQNQKIATNEAIDYWKGNYDLTYILDQEKKDNFILAMVYKVQNIHNYDNYITKLKIITAKSQKDSQIKIIGGDLHIVIPKKHNIINFSFGRPQKNRLICFKQHESILEIKFNPHVIDRYPIIDHQYSVINKKQQNYQKISLKKQQQQKKKSFPDSVALFCFPEGISFRRDGNVPPQTFSFVLTLQDGCRIYCTCLIFYETANEKTIQQIGHFLVDDNNLLYYQKAICLVSHYNYLDQYEFILKHLYRISLSKNDIPIERIICNIVDDIRNKYIFSKIQYIKLKKKGSLIFGTSNKYPPFSQIGLKTLFRVLDIDKIIFLFECVLLEKKIFLISKHKKLIIQVAEALTSLIFPFRYNNVYIPILPEVLKTYLEAPVPFIIGFEQKINVFEISQSMQSEVNKNQIIIFFLKKKKSIQAYLDSNDLINIECLPALPEKYNKQLKKRLQKYEKMSSRNLLQKNLFYERIDNAFENCQFGENEEEEEIDPYDIRDSFLEFIQHFMHNYKKFLIPPDKKKANNEMSEIYDIREFLNYHKSSKQGTFLSKFVETGIFSYFIETRTSISEYEPYYQFFDICCKKKRSKKNLYYLQKKTQIKYYLYLYQMIKIQLKIVNKKIFIFLHIYNKFQIYIVIINSLYQILNYLQNVQNKTFHLKQISNQLKQIKQTPMSLTKINTRNTYTSRYTIYGFKYLQQNQKETSTKLIIILQLNILYVQSINQEKTTIFLPKQYLDMQLKPVVITEKMKKYSSQSNK
ncbi:hypothetical protein IMG5_187430 [Ichthyophthirius multifiliis]|uniref:UDENN domain-containing protein n=1 Tax=Ichthyophthirius multifiliis TaxID=5932 RepID=G0R3T2_ICHMU|nr:hypothetical protein IMG5_187430 [Ichthyophthirius multifiliis]EGR27899.1 hypothetical protein IMG5_187430 [Ichthyophthirius multifiliis]|eukprot:XP_004027244.1 hypothetical protein IMG5_187430 [Ichthyophthirius multifiliis]